MKKKLNKILVIVLSIACLSGCGEEVRYTGNAVNSFDGAEASITIAEPVVNTESSSEYTNTREINGTNGGTLTTIEVPESMKDEMLVYSAVVTIETMKYDEATDKLNELMEQYDCFIESANYDDDGVWDRDKGYRILGERNAKLEIRVPSKHFNTFISGMNSVGNVVSSNTSVENINTAYQDNNAQIESNEKQLKVLQEMYAKARTINEMINIESRIAEVDAKLIRLKASKRAMENDVQYSTVSLYLKEVVKYSDTARVSEQQTFLDRVVLECKESFNSFIEFIEGIILWLIRSIWKIGILGIIAWFIWKKRPTIQKRISNKANRKALKDRTKKIIEKDRNKEDDRQDREKRKGRTKNEKGNINN